MVLSGDYHIAQLLKRAPPTGFPAADYQAGDSSEHSNKRMRPIGVSEEVCVFIFYFDSF